MNKSELKTFAVNARLELIRRVSDRAARYGITEECCEKSAAVPSASFQKLGGVLLTRDEIRQRDALLRRVAERGYRQAMEESAYTWFNRLIALRYMQAHNLLPVDVRVLPGFAGETPPLVTEAHNVTLDGADPEKVLDMVGASETEALYKYLLIALCNQLSGPLPQMFEKISDYTELLFPDGILREDSVLGMLAQVDGDNWREIQVIGWLYQYYNAELKQETFDLLKKNVKITKDRIGAATQLFTPEWIVNYMVENSLGRLWLEGHPDQTLRMKWRYDLDEAEQEPEVAAKLAEMREPRKTLRPDQITLLDPCMGSGHILVYAFDVLMDIYRSVGYTDRDAVRSIVEHNLFGLDIDDRAAQLAYFAVMMKACAYDRRFLKRGVQPHVCAIQESNSLEAFSRLSGRMRLDALCLGTANALIDAFRDAKEYGSILSPAIDSLSSVEDLMRQLEEASLTDVEIQGWYERAKVLLPQLAGQAEIMQRKYDAVVTNPPYMGSSGMGEKLSRYVKENHPDSKSDLFAVFMERCGGMIEQTGYQAMITQHAWMFLSSFEKLRGKLMQMDTVNMAHLGARAFEEIGGEVVQTTAFVLCKAHTKGYQGTYVRLIEPTTQDGKEEMFLSGKNRYTARQDNFSKIPGAPVAYWVSEAILRAFAIGLPLEVISNPRQGMIPGNVDAFLRFWFEVNCTQIGFDHTKNEDITIYRRKWFPYNKGGAFRRWYGNIEHIINMKDNGYDIKYSGQNNNFRLREPELYFKEAITWSKISSGAFSARYMPNGNLFDIAGCCIFELENKLNYVLAFSNSKITASILNVISPTLNYEVDHIKKLPVVFDNGKFNKISLIVSGSISLSRNDWDAFETSWYFKIHPLV